MTNQLVQDHGVAWLLLVCGLKITNRALHVAAFRRHQSPKEDADIILRILLECPGGVCGGFVQVPFLGAESKS